MLRAKRLKMWIYCRGTCQEKLQLNRGGARILKYVGAVGAEIKNIYTRKMSVYSKRMSLNHLNLFAWLAHSSALLYREISFGKPV